MTEELVQQIIKEKNPDLDVEVGSGIYFTNVVPTTVVMDTIQASIDQLKIDSALSTASTPEIKDKLLTNFGIPRILGKKSTGILEVKVSSSQEIYSFPEGTEFSNAEGLVMVSTTAILLNTQTSTLAKIPVESLEISNLVVNIGGSFTCSIYGNLITSVKVISTIGGGSLEETDEELTSRIVEELTENTIAPSAIKIKIKRQFNTLIDILISKDSIFNRSELNRPSGLPLDLYVKTFPLLTSISLTPKNNVYNGPILRIINSNVPFTVETKNKGTAYETNTFSITSNALIDIMVPNELKEIQDFVDNSEIFPFGCDFLVRHANPVFVSGVITGVTKSSITSYVTNKKIGNFDIAELLSIFNSFKLPITLTFSDEYNGTSSEVNTEYLNEFGAYYDEGITIV